MLSKAFHVNMLIVMNAKNTMCSCAYKIIIAKHAPHNTSIAYENDNASMPPCVLWIVKLESLSSMGIMNVDGIHIYICLY